MQRFKLKLSVKLSIFLVLSMVAVFGAMGMMNVRVHRTHLRELIYESADRISDVVARSTHYSMLKNEREEIYRIIDSIAREPGIEKIRIFNKEGEITFSTSPAEVNHKVNMQAEACNACHSGSQPLTDVARSLRARTFHDADGKLLLGVIRPIKSEAACTSAACHAHEEGKLVLGVLDVVMELDRVEAAIARQGVQMFWTILLATVLICLVSIAFIVFFVDRPLKKILRGTERIASGDLDSRIDVTSGDEIGELANSFNIMSRELKSARAEVTNWAETLERQVEERSEQLKKAQEKMVQSEKMASVGKLSAIVAHEINNPLAGIRTYSKLLQKKLGKLPRLPEYDECERDLKIIETESARCGDIVRSLLQFSRPSAVRLTKHDVNELVRSSLRLVQHKLELLGAETRLSLADRPLEITCDGQKLQQALVAVFINACEAMPQGSGILEVASRPVPERDGIEIRISDNGTGMDRETLHHVFEPFFTTKQDVEKGTSLGLGLSVVYGIVKSHDGEITPQSEVGKGTTFTLFLPVKPKPGSADAWPDESGEEEGGGS